MDIGSHTYVGDFGSVSARVRIGNYTSIAPFVEMHSRTEHGCIANPALVSTSCGQIPNYPAATARDTITIGHDVWIGRNAVLLGGITIGNGAIIGAYSVVAKDVQPYEVVVGNPIRRLRWRFALDAAGHVRDDDTIDQLLDMQWWYWPDEVVAERTKDLQDVKMLVAKYGYVTFPTNYG